MSINRKSEAELFFTAILRSYSIIFFSQSRLFGAVLLLATLIAPSFGFTGLAGLVVSYAVARWLGFDVLKIRKGAYLFNSLLVSLALAYLHNFQTLQWGASVIVLVAVSVVSLLVSVVMIDTCYRHYALPALSLPFVWVTFVLFFLFYSFFHTPITSEAPFYLLPAIGNLPDFLTGFLQALGAIFFLPHTAVGLIVFICLISWSRLAVLYAVVGYLSGILFMQSLGMAIQPGNLGFIGFNFVFSAIALGGVFLVPSCSSLVLVVLGSFFCVILGVAVNSFLNCFGIPPLALPLNVVILLVLYVMKCRTRVNSLFVTPFEPQSPEYNFRQFYTASSRFPDVLQPHMHLPFFGERTITQSFDGGISHRGDWKEALDFEIVDEAGNKFMYAPLDLAGNFIFDSPVLAPCNGIVVKVVANVHDNLIGETNTDQNWGNTVIIRDDIGWFVKLSHLKLNSIDVFEGARVVQGQVIGRCGNSGRSPVPHLHMQVQNTPLLGEKTQPFKLTQYFTTSGKRKQYHTSGVPKINDVVSPIVFDDKFSSCFEFGEKTWNYHFNDRNETVHSSFNVMGDYELVSGATKLTARVKDRTFYTLDYCGGVDSVLFYIYICLSRVPFVSDETVFWTDVVNMRPLLWPWAATLFDFVGPFIHYPLAKLESRISHAGKGVVCIETQIDYRVPRLFLRSHCPKSISIRLSDDGVEEIEVRVNGSVLRGEKI